MKTAVVILVLCLVTGFVILRALRAMKNQIAADAAASDDWKGAKRFGGKFEGDRPPPEEDVRRDWTPVRAPTSGALAKPGAGSAGNELSETLLRKYVDWCDKRCTAGWLIVLPVSAPATIWFRERADAESFARHWHTRAGT
ncbi:hypothetical protein [Hwanghaeella sp.]|uniref:hypothetical protein n=1 Tax=Hwanghaeella sp. TaxID=2605943 RepID=UPI003CCC1254